jgi:hypothetical protein
MTITEEVALVIANGQEHRKEDSQFAELQAFYEEMKRLGIAKKPEYTAPQLDTVGRGFYKALVVKESPPVVSFASASASAPVLHDS